MVAVIGRRTAGALLTACGCLAVVGCGSSRAPAAPLAHHPATSFPAVARVGNGVGAQQRTLHEQVLARLHSPVARNRPGVASYLPRSTTKVNRIVTATRSHPQLAIAGDSVVLSLSGGRTLATMNGPLYNNKYVGTNDPTVPAAFLLTFTDTRGTIPLAPRDFTVLDQLGNNIVLRITVRGGGRMPAHLSGGERLTLVMTTTIAAGDGSIVYNPTGITRSGHVPLAGWDFIVEDD